MERQLDFSALGYSRSPNTAEWLSGKLDEQSVAARQQMAAVNGFQYIAADRKFAPGSGSIFPQGETLYLNIFSGNFVGFPFHFFHSVVSTGSRFATVFRFTLPRALPHMVIDSHIDDTGVLPSIFTAEQRVKLEGDFAKYFTTYAPKKYEQSMVNVLAPDIMHVLLAYAAHCDIEIVDNYLYFYWPYTLYSPQDAQKIFTTAHAVMYQLHDKLSRSDIYGTPEQKQLHAVGGRGARLTLKKKSVLDYFFDIGPWVIGIFLVYKPEFMPQFVEGYANILFVLLPLLGLKLFYDSLKKRQLKQELEQRNKTL